MSEDDPAGQGWVVIASFGNRHAAEHMLASLGRDFRRNAHLQQSRPARSG